MQLSIVNLLDPYDLLVPSLVCKEYRRDPTARKSLQMVTLWAITLLCVMRATTGGEPGPCDIYSAGVSRLRPLLSLFTRSRAQHMLTSRRTGHPVFSRSQHGKGALQHLCWELVHCAASSRRSNAGYRGASTWWVRAGGSAGGTLPRLNLHSIEDLRSVAAG